MDQENEKKIKVDNFEKNFLLEIKIRVFWILISILL